MFFAKWLCFSNQTKLKDYEKTNGLIALGLSLSIGTLQAVDAKNYQVTGPVLEITPTISVFSKKGG
jgi:hypothetical protein